MNINHYTYRVTWSEEDQEHVGLCAEFPSLSFLAKAPADAFAGIVDVVRVAVEDMQASGEKIPQPLAEMDFSGKFVVRVSSHVHRSLAIQAAEQGLSINKLVNYKLTA